MSFAACGLAISNKIVYELTRQEYITFKKHNERVKHFISYFDDFYRKCLQDIVVGPKEYASLFKIFTKNMVENKNSSPFHRINFTNKYIF